MKTLGNRRQATLAWPGRRGRPAGAILLCVLGFTAKAALLALGAQLEAAEALQAGVATVDITPPTPYRMSGYFIERLSTGVKDPLHAKAVVFQQGAERAALVFCDLCGLSRDTVAQARENASEATGIPVDHIAVTATHSHTGPLYFGALRDHFHQRAIERLSADKYEKINYGAELAEKIAAAIVKASLALEPVDLAAGFAREDRLSFNRRFHMRDGSVRFNPGELNPDIVRPAGPIDPQVGLVSLKKPGATQPHAAAAVFALHLDTTGGTEYSADFPKFAEDKLRASFGEGFTLLFGAGTCGDVNHIDVSTQQRRPTEQIGELLGDTVEEAMQNNALKPIAEPLLAVRTATVDAALQTYPAAAVAEAKRNMDLIGSRELPFLKQVEACKITSLQSYTGPTLPLEVQAFRLGRDVAIVTLPGEIFVELGLAIKAASPFETTLVVELVNESLGYIPTKKAFAEGSYETVNSCVESGSGEKLVEAAVRLLREFK